MRKINWEWMDANGTVNYDAYIHSRDWYAKRDKRIKLDNYTCQVCGTTERPLQVHHRTYKNLGNEPMEDLITVCSVCHSIISEIEHTKLSDKICDGLKNLNILKMQYQITYRAMIECVISNAIVRHISEIPEAYGSFTTQLEPWISNIIEFIRSSRQSDIQKAGTKPKSIAHLIADGTFKKGRTYQQNVSEHIQWTRKWINRLPSIPDWP